MKSNGKRSESFSETATEKGEGKGAPNFGVGGGRAIEIGIRTKRKHPIEAGDQGGRVGPLRISTLGGLSRGGK